MLAPSLKWGMALTNAAIKAINQDFHFVRKYNAFQKIKSYTRDGFNYFAVLGVFSVSK